MPTAEWLANALQREYEDRTLEAAIAKSFEKQVDHGVRTKRKSNMPAKRWKKVVSTEPGGLGG